MGGARTALTLVVTGIWALATLVSLISGKYGTLEAVTPVMTIVAGFLFSTRGDPDRPASKPKPHRRTPPAI